jgi:hypothetical protein
VLGLTGRTLTQFHCTFARDEANGPLSKQLQSVCHDTLPWLISISLGDYDVQSETNPMKLLRVILPIILTGLVCGLAGYRVGQQRQRRVTFSMIEGDFVSGFTALKNLRAGDTNTAIRRIETHTFMSATLLLYDRHAEHKWLNMFTSELVDYRHTYRSNPSDWTPMEQNLEQLLSPHK